MGYPWHANIKYTFFQGIWYGIVHHTVNEHEWILPYSDAGPSVCQHGPLSAEREKGWLKAGTPPHDALIQIVMDKNLLRKIPYYLKCRRVLYLIVVLHVGIYK